MKISTHTIMYQAKFAGGRSRLDLLLPSFLPSREEKKKQDRFFCPLRGHSVGRMLLRPTTCRQETLFLINSQEERTETKMQEQKNYPLGNGAEWHTPHMDRVRIETKKQEQKNHPSGSRGVLHTPHTDRVRIEKKKQERIFCPLRGHAVGRMQYTPTSYRQETLFPINSQEERTETKMQEQKNYLLGYGAEWHTPHMDRVRIETKTQEQIFYPLWGHAVGRMQYAPTSCRQERLFPINSQEERIETKTQERRKQSIDSGAELHTFFMRHGERDVVWREAFLEQRAHVTIWRDRRLEERSSHARLQLRTFGENSKPYKSSLVALSEQLRDIFSA